MEQNPLLGALTRLPERLTAFDQRVGPYLKHISTGKGITLITLGCSLFLYPSLIYKIVNNPESVTEEDITRLMNFARFNRQE